MAEPFCIDDRSAPEVFASFLWGAAFDAPNVRLTFASMRVDHTNNPGVVNQVTNLRLVMSIPAANNMVAFLTEFLKTAHLNEVNKSPNQPLQ